MKIVPIVSMLILLTWFSAYAQHESSMICDQSNEIIKYLRNDSLVKSTFKVKECNFRISKELGSGGIDPLFFEEYMFYLFNKRIELIDKNLIDSTYGKIVDTRKSDNGLIHCLKSDVHCNLTLDFSLENDSILSVVIYQITKNKYFKRNMDINVIQKTIKGISYCNPIPDDKDVLSDLKL